MKLVTLVLLAIVIALSLVMGQNPHTIAACSPTGRTGAKCGCMKAVSEIQQRFIDECYLKSRNMDDVRKCMGRMPACCTLMKNRPECKTNCKPHHCRCCDTGCPEVE